MSFLIIASFFTALFLSLLFVPAVRLIARRIGLVDRPDCERKLHRTPIALGGGIAVFFATTMAFVATIYLDRSDIEWSAGVINSRWYTLFGAASLIMVVGLVDDYFTLRGRQKLLFQCLIASGLVGSGTVINSIGLFGINVPLGILAFPITVLWLLIAINALNLLDGADGMATTAGMIISAGLGFLALQTNNPFSSIVGFALAGALLGFLAYNRPPASIFLGDAGSMTIGLLVGVLAIWSGVKETTMLASAPVAVLAIPLFDSTAAIMRRWLTGRSMYATDRAHLHHLLQARYGSAGMLLVVATLCLITTSSSVLSLYWNQPWISAIGMFTVFGLLIFTRSFGHAECRLLASKLKHFVHSFLMLPSNVDQIRQTDSIPLQGNGRWETIWEPLVDFAKVHGFSVLRIDLSMAWIHEGYHASWNSVRQPDKSVQLKIRVPLFAHRSTDGVPVPIGRIEIVAPGNTASSYRQIASLGDLIQELEPQINQIIAQIEARLHHAGYSTPERLVLTDSQADDNLSTFQDHSDSGVIAIPNRSALEI